MFLSEKNNSLLDHLQQDNAETKLQSKKALSLMNGESVSLDKLHESAFDMARPTEPKCAKALTNQEVQKQQQELGEQMKSVQGLAKEHSEALQLLLKKMDLLSSNAMAAPRV